MKTDSKAKLGAGFAIATGAVLLLLVGVIIGRNTAPPKADAPEVAAAQPETPEPPIAISSSEIAGLEIELPSEQELYGSLGSAQKTIKMTDPWGEDFKFVVEPSWEIDALTRQGDDRARRSRTTDDPNGIMARERAKIDQHWRTVGGRAYPKL